MRNVKRARTWSLPQTNGFRSRMAEIPEYHKKGYLRAVQGQANARGAVRAMCLECVGWKIADVKNCTAPECPLFPYRPAKHEGEGLVADQGPETVGSEE